MTAAHAPSAESSRDLPGAGLEGHEPLLLLASASAGRRATLAAAGIEHTTMPVDLDEDGIRSEERRVGKECRSRWSPYH